MKKILFKHVITISLLFYIVFIATAYSAIAVTIPSFPSCLNPQGTLDEPIKEGIHGVPGDTTGYTGIDAVYKLTNNDTVMQCLCPPNGKAIQTNWWKIPELTDQEIEELKNDGWIYIPNGAAWGLSNAPYLAKNIQYSCIGGKGDDGGKNDDNGGSSSDNNGGSSSSNPVSTGVNQILGLAGTGNMQTIYAFSLLGILLLSLGIYTGHAHSQKSK